MVERHPIEGLMTTAMNSIREMVDVNTIVGDAVQSPDGSVIIPISRVSFGFAAGGGEYCSFALGENENGNQSMDDGENMSKPQKYPFAGGSGAGVSINPVAFMVVGNGTVKLLPVNVNSTVDKVLDLVPELIHKLEELVKKKTLAKKETIKEEIKEEEIEDY